MFGRFKTHQKRIPGSCRNIYAVRRHKTQGSNLFGGAESIKSKALIIKQTTLMERPSSESPDKDMSFKKLNGISIARNSEGKQDGKDERPSGKLQPLKTIINSRHKSRAFFGTSLEKIPSAEDFMQAFRGCSRLSREQLTTPRPRRERCNTRNSLLSNMKRRSRKNAAESA